MQGARRTPTGEDPQPIRARTQARGREVFDLNTQAQTMTPATLPHDKLGSHLQLVTTPRNPTEPNRISEIRHQRQWTMNQAVKRRDAVEPRPQSVLEIVSTGAVGWASFTLMELINNHF